MYIENSSTRPIGCQVVLSDCRKTALTLLSKGYWPVVLHTLGELLPNGLLSKGKEPIVNEWGIHLPTEDDLLRLYDANPGAGVGIRLGPEGKLIDLEVDGPEGEESFLMLCGGEIVETRGWTSRRGQHRLFRWDDRLAALGVIKTVLDQLPGLEIRTGLPRRQAQSACPPTLGEDGVPRVWCGPKTIATLPETAIQFILDAVAAKRPEPTQDAAAERNGHIDGSPTATWYRKALEGEAGKVAIAPAGGRNQALLAAARTLGGKLHPEFLPEADVIRELTHAAKRAGLPDREIADTLTRGLDYGKAQPLPGPASAETRLNSFNSFNSLPLSDGDEDSEPLEIAKTPWPAPPDDAAYHGLAGRIVRKIEPQTESDPVAILIQLMVMFGNAIDRTAYYQVESSRHYTNEFAVLVGETSGGRKGTSADWVKSIMSRVDGTWAKTRVIGGLSSGEGVISSVRDETWQDQPIREKGRVIDYQKVKTDAGVSDKRVLFEESEFGGVLRALEREGNKLSAILRQMWDRDFLSTATKVPLSATGTHGSIIGHITFGELKTLLTEMESVNGFANRFIWVAVRRSKFLPFGGKDVDLNVEVADLHKAIEFAKLTHRVEMDVSARELWTKNYARLTVPHPGILGQVTSRAAPHVMRLALIYALLDCQGRISPSHLQAALSLWDASSRCAAHIFGDSLGNIDAEKILKALKDHPDGLTRTEISEIVFKRNTSMTKIKAALGLLMIHRGVQEIPQPRSKGRPAIKYVYEKNE